MDDGSVLIQAAADGKGLDLPVDLQDPAFEVEEGKMGKCFFEGETLLFHLRLPGFIGRPVFEEAQAGLEMFRG